MRGTRLSKGIWYFFSLASVVVGAVWIAQLWLEAEFEHRTSEHLWHVDVGCGRLSLWNGERASGDYIKGPVERKPIVRHIYRRDGRWRWDWAFVWSRDWDMYMVHVPFWSIFPLTLAPAVWMAVSDYRAGRRTRFGRCAACGYDRRGLAADAPCPECGKQ